MSFKEAVQSVFSKYAVFEGRARRSEYWYFVLFNSIVSLVLSLIGQMIGGDGSSFQSGLTGVYSLAVLVPSIAVSVRRLHDVGKAGTWYLINFVPIIGWIVFIVFAAKDSDPGENQYGPCPK